MSVVANDDKSDCCRDAQLAQLAQLAHLAVSQTPLGQNAFDEAQEQGEAGETDSETCLEWGQGCGRPPVTSP